MVYQRSHQTKTAEATHHKTAAAPVQQPLPTRTPLHPLLQLQRLIGNRAFSQLIQAKLKVSQPGDVFEQEADRIADAVMRMQDPRMLKKAPISQHPQQSPIQRVCSECEEELHRQPMEEEEEEKVLHAKEVPGSTPVVTPDLEANIDSMQGGGQPLPESVRAFFEPRFGSNFSQVRIHTDAQAAESARAVNALAYTVGRNVVFGAGQYAPEFVVGQQLLAHELTHVVQQQQEMPSQHGEGLVIRLQQIGVRGSPPLRPHIPTTPTIPPIRWQERIFFAMGEQQEDKRAQAYLQLINEAVTPDAERYPELSFPVKLVVPEKAAVHGEVYFDVNRPKAKQGRTHSIGTKIFIVMGPGALDPKDGPVFTRRVLNHEYIHFLQNQKEILTEKPACNRIWKATIGELRELLLTANANREVEAASTTFARFFSIWLDAALPGTTIYPNHLIQELAYLQFFFPCADLPGLKGKAIARIVATVRNHPDRRQHLRRLAEKVRDIDLPSIRRLDLSDNAMMWLLDAIGVPIQEQETRVPTIPRPAFKPLFDPSQFGNRSREGMHTRILESSP